MRIVGRDGRVSELLKGVPEVYQRRIGTGMYDVVTDRDFAKNRTIYFTYHTKADADPVAMGRIAKARLSADEKSLEDVKVLREGADIQPRRIVQARDGTLLVLSTGDLADVGPDPQTLSSQAGKVLRIGADGQVPKDNPFLADKSANPAVWALGFRDIHAAVINPHTGELWVAENEPMGGDELNVMRKGRNYGFPVISYGRQNSGALINDGKTVQAGMEQPLYFWTPSIAPSGMLIYTGKAFPAWKNNVFISAMSGQQLVRLEMKGEKVAGEEKLLMDGCHRFKVVAQGPDGFIYLLTDEAAPKQNEILRLVPAKAPPTKIVPPRKS
jgi:glucose/arabinose dehydrogenase